MLIGTAGHIDHGRTTPVKALTGVDADRLPEEKSRGITLDVGYAYTPLSEWFGARLRRRAGAPQDLFASGEEPLCEDPLIYRMGPRSSVILLAR